MTAPGFIRRGLVRAYHSYDHLPHTPYTPAQSAILSAALAEVPERGFTKSALAAGARAAGYLDTTPAVFHHGVFDVVRYHLYAERTRLAGLKQQIDDEEGHPQGKKVRRYVVERLRRNVGVIHRWPEALAIMATPSNAPTALEELGLLSDEIWFLAGDESSDFEWYTKRASLAAIYSATELYMSQDNSVDYEMTWDFLDRRLQDAHELSKSLGSTSAWVTFAGLASLNLLRSQIARG
ncbi:COQ9-domain-containing protein [Limtongia smithiae]|uniref:COQ9-domain-containing protein n=1 Tax=Limtongia smithiae TaxID=1125753 RepID=UPI0034CD612C